MSYFIGNFQESVDEKKLVGLITTQYENIPQEIINSGAIIPGLPVDNPPVGYMNNGLYYNTLTKEVYYDYMVIPVEPIDDVTQLRIALAEMAEVMERQKLNNQLALAELAEAMMGGV